MPSYLPVFFLQGMIAVCEMVGYVAEQPCSHLIQQWIETKSNCMANNWTKIEKVTCPFSLSASSLLSSFLIPYFPLYFSHSSPSFSSSISSCPTLFSSLPLSFSLSLFTLSYLPSLSSSSFLFLSTSPCE